MADKHNKTVMRRYVILLWFSWMLSDDTLYISVVEKNNSTRVAVSLTTTTVVFRILVDGGEEGLV
jgi:hypothetical protein